MSNQELSEDGFTLVELLVVILIIGILTAIAVPAFLNQRKEAYNAALKQDLHNVSIAVNSYIASKPGDRDIQPSELYTYVGKTFTSGSDILIFGGQDNWCLMGVNWNSTNNSYDGSKGLIYESYDGGLQPAGTNIWTSQCVYNSGSNTVLEDHRDLTSTSRADKSLNHWQERRANAGDAKTAQEAAIAIAAGK